MTLTADAAEDYEQPPISYSTAAPQDPISRLQQRPEFSASGKESVRAFLHELNVPTESQLLVFSKTSVQRQRIRPDHPRAIFFSDTCYVGWVPGGLVEVASIDPSLGPIFYTFDPETTAHGKERRALTRDNDCLRCHGGSFVRGIPAVFARSLFADDRGEPLLRQGTQIVDYRTPFAERWGGWYVTGKHGEALHRGNVFAREDGDRLVVNLRAGANLTDLSQFFNAEPYLAATSDIVALMVFEHQTAIQNALTRAGQNCRRMLAYQRNLQTDLHEPVTDEPSYDSVKSVFATATQDVVDHLLFKDEAELPPGIEGSPAFQRAFVKGAPRSSQGDGLKDLLLEKHLFRHRCSYLIYSPTFLALPPILKSRIYERLRQALHPVAPHPRYAYLSGAERRRIVQILAQTHPDLKQTWGESTARRTSGGTSYTNR